MVKELDFCKIEFHSNYVICNINEGETISQKRSEELTKVLLNHFKEKSFVYITHRIYSYSVDPTIYNKLSKIKTFTGFAVVSSNLVVQQTAEVEKLFFKKPFKIFNDLETAKEWASIIANS